MRFEISLPIEIRPLHGADLDGLQWDSEQAIQAEYVRKTAAERGEEVVFLLALANGQPVGLLGIDFGRKADHRRASPSIGCASFRHGGILLHVLRRFLAES